MHKKLLAEALGTSLLAMAVLGASQAATPLQSGGMVPVSIVAGLMLFVLITVFAPVSGGHLNPLITLYFLTQRDIGASMALAYVAAQIGGAVVGSFIVDAMFQLPLWQVSSFLRDAPVFGISEAVAGFGFVLVVSGGMRANAALVPALVGGFATSAVWFTSSGGFANPAVIVGRMLSATPGGVAPMSAPFLVISQFAGAGLAIVVARYLFEKPSKLSE